MVPRPRSGGGEGRGGHGPPPPTHTPAFPAPTARDHGGCGGGGAMRRPESRPFPGPTASGSVLATAAAAVESFFLDSTASDPAAEDARPLEIRPVVCVLGLARGCGVTVVARALAAELALRDPAGAAVVCSDDRPPGVPL